MTSSPDSSPSEPTSDPPSNTEHASSAEQAVERANDEQRRSGAPIRIGTQRYGAKAPQAVAHPVLPSPPPELLAKAAALSAPRPSAPETTHAPVTTAEGRPAAAASSETVAPNPASPGTVPREGSSRDSGPREGRPARRQEKKSTAPRVINEVAPRKYPPPNVRGQLTPDLEMEYLAAVGDASVDEIIESGASEVVVELEAESRHRGKVISIHRDSVFVELPGRQQGIAPLRNFATPPEPGALVDVMVSRFNPAEETYELTLPGAAIDVSDWSEVAEGMVVEARVTGHNKGGLECEVSRLRGFIPASQISMYRVEDLSQFVDQKFACVVTEANAEKRNLVLSRRAMLEREQAEAKEKLLAELEVGQVREATVRNLQSFGAFVDLGGVDGLIHISQLSWDRIKHASEVLEVGQKVKVKIQKIDPDTGKIGLVFRDLSESPWANAGRDFPARGRVKGRVSRLMEFGAFVRLGPGVEGLIHISELSHKRVFRVSDVLAEGQEVEVLVLSVDAEAQRISLSLKALEARPQTEKEKAAAAELEEPETPAEPAKKRKTPLKGGTGGPATGDKFGLKW